MLSHARGSSKQNSSDPVDPLQDLGFRRKDVALSVIGSYAQLQSFLQEMEKLEVVEASDLNLNVASDSGADDGPSPTSRESLSRCASVFTTVCLPISSVKLRRLHQLNKLPIDAGGAA